MVLKAYLGDFQNTFNVLNIPFDLSNQIFG